MIKGYRFYVWIFDDFWEMYILYNHHPNQDLTPIQYHRRFLCVPLGSLLLSTLSQTNMDLISVPVLKLHINGTMQYAFFCVCLLSLYDVFLIDACLHMYKQSVPFCWWLFILCRYYTCLWIDIHLLLGMWVVFSFWHFEWNCKEHLFTWLCVFIFWV